MCFYDLNICRHGRHHVKLKPFCYWSEIESFLTGQRLALSTFFCYTPSLCVPDHRNLQTTENQYRRGYTTLYAYLKPIVEFTFCV